LRKIILTALLATASLLAADPRIGTWKQSSFERTVDPPVVLTIEVIPSGVHLFTVGGRDYTAFFDGKYYAVKNGIPTEEVSVQKSSKYLLEATRRTEGRVSDTIKWEASMDGEQLVRENRASKTMGYKTAYDRSGGAKDPENIFAGKWTQNLTRTAIIDPRPEVFTFSASEAEGVHFEGQRGFSYTAQFDGKDYKVTNSLFDAISVKAIDERTIEETWKADGKVWATSRFVISQDGQEMTRTSEGKQNDGSRYREKVVFRKQ